MRVLTFTILFIVLFVKVYGQKPDTIVPHLKILTFENIQSGIQKVTPDTLLDNFQDFMPFRTGWVNSLGNNGSATFPLFFSPPDENVPYFFKPWYIYFDSDRNQYYNTHKPYSNIKFAAGSSKEKGEQFIRLIHTQNINSKLNFSIKATSHNANGSYLRQENRLSCFRFSTNYQGNKYKFFAYYDLEKFKLTDNGGIINDSYIIDSLYKPDNLNVNLSAAKNTLAFRNGYFHQIITLIGKTDSIDSLHSSNKSIIEIHHGGRYQWFKKIYNDEISSFYNNFLIDSTKTHDSLQSEHLTQDLSIVLTQNNPLNIGFLVGGLYDQQNFYHFGNDTLFNSVGMQVSIFKIIEHSISGSLTFENWFSGYKKENSKVDANFRYSLLLPKDTIFFTINGGFWNKNAEYYEKSLYINNYKWNNDILRSEYSNFSISIFDKRFKMGITGKINTVKNYVYYLKDGTPWQQHHTIQILSVEIFKNFTWKHFHFNNKTLIQQSSKENCLPLPSYVGVHSLYYQFLAFKKVLKVQLGAEIYYFTKYFAPRYIPATAQFAIQTERKIGNYPFTDVFINLNLKRACLFFKLEHANYSFSSANYFLATHYPIAPRTLKFGVSWNFYD